MSEFLTETKRKSTNFDENDKDAVKRQKMSTEATPSSKSAAPQTSKLAAPKLVLRPSAFGSSSQDRADSNIKDKGGSNQSNAKINKLFGSSERSSIAPSHLFAKPAPKNVNGSNNTLNIFQPPPSQQILNKNENKSNLTSRQNGTANPTNENNSNVASKQNVSKTSSGLTNEKKDLPVSSNTKTPSAALQQNENKGEHALANSKNVPSAGSQATINENQTIAASTELKIVNPEPTVSKEQVVQVSGRSHSRKSKAPRKNVAAHVGVSQTSKVESTITSKSTLESSSSIPSVKEVPSLSSQGSAMVSTTRDTEGIINSGSTDPIKTASAPKPTLTALKPKPTSSAINPSFSSQGSTMVSTPKATEGRINSGSTDPIKTASAPKPTLTALNPKPTSNAINPKSTSKEDNPKLISNALSSKKTSNAPIPNPILNVFNSSSTSNALKSKAASNSFSKTGNINVLNQKKSSIINSKPTLNEPTPVSNVLKPNSASNPLNAKPISNGQNQNLTSNVPTNFKPTSSTIAQNTNPTSNDINQRPTSNGFTSKPTLAVPNPKPMAIMSEPKLTTNELNTSIKNNKPFLTSNMKDDKTVTNTKSSTESTELNNVPKPNTTINSVNEVVETSPSMKLDKSTEEVDKLDKNDSDLVQNLQSRLNQEIVSHKNDVEQKITSILDDSNATKKRFDCDQCPKSYQHSGSLNKHKVTHSGEKISEIKNEEKKKSVRKATKCGECDSCRRQKDCGKCKNCLDKPKFGGPSKIRQKCIEKVCTNPKKAIAVSDISPHQKEKDLKMDNVLGDNSLSGVFQNENLDESMDLDSSMDAYIDDFKDVDFDDIPLQLQENASGPELNSLFDDLGESSVLDPFPAKKVDDDLELDSSMDSMIDDFLNGSSDLTTDLDTSLDSLLDDVLDDNAEIDVSLTETLDATLSETSKTDSEMSKKQKPKRQRKNAKPVNCKACKNCKRSKDCGKCENCLYKDNFRNENESGRIKSKKYKCLQKVCLNLNINQEESMQKEASNVDRALPLEPNIRNTVDLETGTKIEKANLSKMEDDEELFELFLDVVDLSQTNSQNAKIIATYDNPQISNLEELLNVTKMKNEEQKQVVFDVDEDSYIQKKQKEVVFDVDEDSFILNSSF